jgi:hypothetical protein
MYLEIITLSNMSLHDGKSACIHHVQGARGPHQIIRLKNMAQARSTIGASTAPVPEIYLIQLPSICQSLRCYDTTLNLYPYGTDTSYANTNNYLLTLTFAGARFALGNG